LSETHQIFGNGEDPELEAPGTFWGRIRSWKLRAHSGEDPELEAPGTFWGRIRAHSGEDPGTFWGRIWERGMRSTSKTYL